MMATLIDILSGGLDYSDSWGIYAEKIDGKFATQSPARFGQQIFENGGLLDECEFFCTNTQAEDNRTGWIESYEEYDEDFDFTDLYQEAGEQLIDEVNESLVAA